MLGIGIRNGFRWLRIDSRTSSYEHGYEPSGSIKDGKSLNLLSEYQLLKKGLLRAVC
jgi:hypothetical protein